MEQTTKVYQIAKRLDMRLNEIDKSQSLLHKIQDISQIKASKGSKNENIFQNNEELRLRQLQIQKDRKFELTGGGIVIKYDQAKNKRRKNIKYTTSRQKQSINSYKSARESLNLLIGSSYLTKDEVLRLYTPNSSTIERKSIKQPSQAYYGTNRYKITETQAQNILCSLNQKMYNNSKQNFSITKIKQKMQQYQKVWNKQIFCKKELAFSGLKRQKITKRHLNQKGESIIKKNYKQNENSNSNNYSWVQNLRVSDKREIKQISSRQRRQKHGLVVSGKSKLKKQTIWIQDQHNKGYFFWKNQQLSQNQVNYVDQ